MAGRCPGMLRGEGEGKKGGQEEEQREVQKQEMGQDPMMKESGAARCGTPVSARPDRAPSQHRCRRKKAKEWGERQTDEGQSKRTEGEGKRD
jgi:hypothetical protein